MSWLHRVLGTALAAVFLLAAVVFASIALGIMLAMGLVVWGWLWWRTRGKLPREPNRGHGVVIEGEFEDLTPQRVRRGLDRNG